MSGAHLSDEQMSDLLASQTPDAATQAHLNTCERCRSEVAAMETSLAGFNDRSLAWAMAEAPRRVPVPSRLALGLGGRPAWGLGLAATAAVCLVAFSTGPPFRRAAAPVASLSATAIPSATELAQDNQLMASINQELHYTVQPAVPAAELRSSGRREATHRTGTVAN